MTAFTDTRHPSSRSPSDARELLLAFDPARIDVPQATRRAASLWASQWMDAEPDAFIFMACNAKARNRDAANRQLRLRRLRAELVRFGVAPERIRCTTTGMVTPACEQAGERGLAWFKVMRPDELEGTVLPIDALFEAQPADTETRP